MDCDRCVHSNIRRQEIRSTLALFRSFFCLWLLSYCEPLDSCHEGRNKVVIDYAPRQPRILHGPPPVSSIQPVEYTRYGGQNVKTHEEFPGAPVVETTQDAGHAARSGGRIRSWSAAAVFDKADICDPARNVPK